ncbi:hypothetical protein [Streptomyces lincolnensis]|uniref:hypothetical protein n=1 Tax=Streptomyces lincolnensis TaxID=1915 RepID=UPI0037CE8F29
MAHTFDELVEMQTAADQAHRRVLELRDTYGRPTTAWSPEQTHAYDTAWKDWRAMAADVQAAVTAHAEAEGTDRYSVEAAVRKKARHPEPEPATA